MKRCLLGVLAGLLLTMSAGCRGDRSAGYVDALNAQAYRFHYRNLDSTTRYAEAARRAAAHYGAGYAEALNHLAFVSTAKMEYTKAKAQIEEARSATDNQIELLVSDVMMMRLCQRQSKNKEFYTYKQQADQRLQRIEEELEILNEHQRKRLSFAQSEYYIVLSTYFYYLGLDAPSVEALRTIDPNGEIRKDTAQLLNYYYSVGSGGIIREGDKQLMKQEELENLLTCYAMAKKHGYIYWQANALQAVSEHLLQPQTGKQLVADNRATLQTIAGEQTPDTLLAVTMAGQSVELFRQYGDVYQIAGAYRTLASCYWEMQHYDKALSCLNHALEDHRAILSAPDLVASIREQLSLAYSALNNKPMSDYNRNIYLDMQERTRQDRQLEARAEQLNRSSKQLNWMVLSVVVMIVVVMVLLFLFDSMKRRSARNFSLDSLLEPLNVWEQENQQAQVQAQEAYEQIKEQYGLKRNEVLVNKERNIEQRAKIALVQSVFPLIDRMLNEMRKLLQKDTESEEKRKERLEYIEELADSINENNNILTRWIQIHRGEISLKIESFALQDVFDIVKKGKMAFRLKGIAFEVKNTSAVVKADRVLTLFMLNTLADNARKFTPEHGCVQVQAVEADGYVEISIEDTGEGMSQEQVQGLFNRKTLDAQPLSTSNDRKGYGFGLVNCKGIIEKYKKISSIFSVCSLGVESIQGKGSRFFFRLPKGVRRTLLGLWLVLFVGNVSAQGTQAPSKAIEMYRAQAERYADSAYYCNLNGRYERTLQCADSCISYLNKVYRLRYPNGKHLLTAMGNAAYAAEIDWFKNHVEIDYDIILDFRNEAAVAALALHRWDLYSYNNSVYTQLFRNKSADATLGDYVRIMQTSESNKNVAIILLVLLLIIIFPAYYLLYYRHRVYERFCIDNINRINEILLDKTPVEDKLRLVEHLWDERSIAERASAQLQSLNEIVGKIKAALRSQIAQNQTVLINTQLAEDEVARSSYEADTLYISNNILDNCLSTFKHETMYYPSRIKQLLASSEAHMANISELLLYYKELYAVFLQQAMRQLEPKIGIDTQMLRYLFEQIAKINGLPKLSYRSEANGSYTKIWIDVPDSGLTEEEIKAMFTPSTIDIRYFVCRQLIREFGEENKARGAGIQALRKSDKEITIEIILTTAAWNSLKLLL